MEEDGAIGCLWGWDSAEYLGQTFAMAEKRADADEKDSSSDDLLLVGNVAAFLGITGCPCQLDHCRTFLHD